MHICEWDKHCALCNEQCEAYIEVEPVKHGHWIEVKNFELGKINFSEARCSACNRLCVQASTYGSVSYKYCPRCGAKMDEVT